MGATWVNNSKKMIDRVDCIVSMDFGPTHCEAVLNGEDGLFRGDCNDKLWIDMTTSSPEFMRNLVKDFVAKGGKPVDALVTGSVDAAIRGDMQIFVGGGDAHIGRIEELDTHKPSNS